MINKTLSIFTGIATALLVMGIVWVAGNDGRALAHGNECATVSVDDTNSAPEGSDSGISVDASVAATDDDSDSSNTVSADATVSTSDSTAATTVDDSQDDNGSDESNNTTSTTVAPAPTTTTTQSDDQDHNDDDRHFLIEIDGDVETFTAGDAGNIKVKAVLGKLVLVDVNVNSGWTYEIKKHALDEIEVRFLRSGIYVDVDVEIDHHSLIVDIDVEVN